MTIFRSRAAAMLAATAALAMSASPVMARGWGHPPRHHHHGDGIDAGDVFAGLLVLGGIAAIASAASSARKNTPAREPDYRYPDTRDAGRDGGRDYGEPQADLPGDQGGAGQNANLSIGGAIDACVAEVERGSRAVDTVDEARRAADGWSVEGRLADGRDFSCTVDRDGRARDVTIDRGS